MTTSASTVNENLSAGWRSALTREEIESLLEMNDLRSWGSIAMHPCPSFAAVRSVDGSMGGGSPMAILWPTSPAARWNTMIRRLVLPR